MPGGWPTLATAPRLAQTLGVKKVPPKVAASVGTTPVGKTGTAEPFGLGRKLRLMLQAGLGFGSWPPPQSCLVGNAQFVP